MFVVFGGVVGVYLFVFGVVCWFEYLLEVVVVVSRMIGNVLLWLVMFVFGWGGYVWFCVVLFGLLGWLFWGKIDDVDLR